MPAIPRQKILDRFRRDDQQARPIIGGGAGTGLSAKGEEAGGIDLIIVSTPVVTAWRGAARPRG